MNSAIERLVTLRVRDLMAKGPLTLSPAMAIADAAASLREHRHSAAPVVDANQRCVGFLSATDFLNLFSDSTPDESPSSSIAGQMSTEVHSVSPDTTLLDAGRAMCARHVHRLPVLDESGRVVGVVSSLDLVAAMVKAVEE